MTLVSAVEDELLLDDEPINLVSDLEDIVKESVDLTEKLEDELVLDDEPMNIASHIEEMSIIEEIKKEIVEEIIEETSPIVLDVENISQSIGITKDDYDTFLNEYVDMALTLEDNLKGDDEGKYSSSINTLSHLSNVLQLPVITNIVEKLKDASSDEKNTLIKSLYTTLARLSTSEAKVEKPAKIVETLDIAEEIVEKVAVAEIAVEETVSLVETVEEPEVTADVFDIAVDTTDLTEKVDIAEIAEETISLVETTNEPEVTADLFEIGLDTIDLAEETISPVETVNEPEVTADLFEISLDTIDLTEETISPVETVNEPEVTADVFDIAVDTIDLTEEVKVAVEPEPEPEPEPELIVEDISTEDELPPGSFGIVDLSDVKPIHFDFQMESAANDLSLPVELIEEFVNDFLVQAREETDKMLEAHKQGDLDTVQQIGHLLKGTASNLRINPLADTLYEIQFCEDGALLDKIIKEYWAHFLSFETQITLSSK